MAKRDNVTPLNEALAAAYGIGTNEARKRFGLGRIFGFRSRLVHNGERLVVQGLLDAYLVGLFRDVLFHKLKLPPQGFAEAVVQQPSFDLPQFLTGRPQPDA